MIRGTAILADTSARHSGSDFLIRNLDINDFVNDYAHSVECFRLRNRAWETVKDKTVCTVVLSKSFLDDADNDIIGNKLTRIHEGLCLEAHLRALCEGFTDYIAR